MNIYSESLSICLSFALLIGFYVLWRDYLVDEVRDRLFVLRDEMFLYAYDNELMGSPAYGYMRNLMNSVIRYAHEISFGRLIALVVAHKFLGKPPTDNLEKTWKAIDSLPVEHRDVMRRYQMRMALLIGRQLIKTSVILRFIALLLDIVLWFVRGGDADAKKRMSEKMPVVLMERDALATCAT